MAGSNPVTPVRVTYRKETYGLCIRQTGEPTDAYQTVRGIICFKYVRRMQHKTLEVGENENGCFWKK